MSIFKSPYEISLWEDRLTFVDNDLNEYELFVPNDIKIATSYYKERKICVIGSDTFDAPIRVINPQLKRNINGSNTLTFSLYSKYFDEDLEQFIENPFLKYLTNERKIKLKYIEKGQEKWLDFIIKNINENSETYLYSYTATDLFVNELSKTGFNLVFNEKLNNNIGTVDELGERIIEGTDWRIGENSEIIRQTQQEALYKVILNRDIEGIYINPKSKENMVLNISHGKIIYVFYSCIANQEKDFFQFLYREDGQYLVDENRVLTNADEFYLTVKNMAVDGTPDFAENIEYTSDFRGNRSVRKQRQVFDEKLQQYVLVYKDINNDDTEVYGFSENEYISPDLIRSYITNPNSFINTSGWKQRKLPPLELAVFPSFQNKPQFFSNRLSALKYNQDKENFLFNSGINDNAFYIKTFAKNEEYIFRIKCKETLDLLVPKCFFKVQVKTYEFDQLGNFIDGEKSMTIFEGRAILEENSEGYFKCKMTSNFSLSEKQLQEQKIGIFITAVDEKDDIIEKELYIIDTQFYKFAKDENGNECLPNGQVIEHTSDGNQIITNNFKSFVNTIYYYYLPNQSMLPKEERQYLHIGKQSNIYQPKFNLNYEKIRSISASGSNRFNLLQKLAETFECWCKFEIMHKPNGEIMLAKDLFKEITYDGGNSQSIELVSIDAGNLNENSNNYPVLDAKDNDIKSLYYPQKFITFHENIGQTNNVDFIYGINLKSITRTVESNNIITKLIVKTNNNQFAPLGGCDISRAKENPTGGNILYNFNQYISQGLLDADNFNNDLYSLNASRGWIGFYTRLKQVNQKIQRLEQEKNTLLGSRANLTSQYTTSSGYEKYITELKEKEEEFYMLTKYSIDTIPENSNSLKEDKIIALGETILKLRNQIVKAKKENALAEEQLEILESKLEKIASQLELLQKQKEELFSVFENKYSRFIQEGPWTSEDYTDDELYYLDSDSTLFNSSQPKIQYNINTIEVSVLEGYEDFSYGLGDITHIQDTDFFGWQLINGNKTPYREKVVVTEVIINFDSPEKNTIKVQNYRTQFEDLFQRITAATQQVEFYSGAYEKAASVILPNGNIMPEALTDAFSKNTQLLKNANNQSVKWDDKGITATNLSNPAEIVRLVSGGIFISNDGGSTWTTGITGNGINAKTITTGQLNTGLITILNGDQPAFRWDSSGISAYKQEDNGRYNNRTYVRFDQFGLYGMKNGENTPKDIEAIWDNASFSLTWKGFKLRTGKENGAITIDTENDFTVFNKDFKIIQIGRIGNTNQEEINYGIIIRDPNLSEGKSKDKIVFKADQEGLYIGGWKITENAFESPDLTGDNQPEIAIYSQPFEEEISSINIENQKWRILARNRIDTVQGEKDEINFGLNTDGNVYCKGMFVQGFVIMKTGRLQDDQGNYYELVMTLDGITINSYADENINTAPETSKVLKWIDLVNNFQT